MNESLRMVYMNEIELLHSLIDLNLLESLEMMNIMFENERMIGKIEIN